MTVPVQTGENSYTANGATSVFPYTFKILDQTHLKVYKDDVLQLSGYAVSGVGNNSGGNVTFSANPTNGAQVRLERTLPVDQQLDLGEYTRFPAESVERQFDRLAMVDEQQDRKTSGLRAEFEEFVVGTDSRFDIIEQDVASNTSDIETLERAINSAIPDSALVLALADVDSTVLVADVEARRVALTVKNGISSAKQRGLPESYALGFDSTTDIEYQNTADSTDKLVNGNMSVGKSLFGIRRNATVLSARANASDGFEPQITGVTGSQELADYGSADQCAVFADITTTPFNSWEIVAEPVYTTSGFTAAGVDASKIKIGMIAKTDHPEPYWGIVTSVSSGGCTVDKWSKAGAPLDILPTSGFYGLKINPIFKLWAINANVVLTPDGRADVGAICEFGLINQKIPNPTQTNGVDMIVLGSSTYDGTAAYLSRGGGSSKWQYGLYDQGSKTAAVLAEGSARGLAAQGVTTGYV